MLGAGDIKLMAVCTGFLGIEQGAQMIVCGLLLALIVESFRSKIRKYGYPESRKKKVRLAPYLFLGHCVYWFVLQ